VLELNRMHIKERSVEPRVKGNIATTMLVPKRLGIRTAFLPYLSGACPMVIVMNRLVRVEKLMAYPI